MKEIFGWELTLDLYDCNERIKDQWELERYAQELCVVLDMKPYKNCILEHFGHNDKRTAGYTMIQLIETSNISGHFSEHYRTAHLNIFSCKDFDGKQALVFSAEFFGAKVRESRCFARFL